MMWRENVDFDNAKIMVLNRSSSNGYPPFYLKDYEERAIDAPVWVIDALKELKHISNSKNPYVFLSDRRLKLVEAKWQEMVSMGMEKKWINTMVLLNTHRKFSNYCKWAGIKTTDRLSVHCLRKAYGTNLADLGTPVHTLKSLMGHSNIQTTMEFYLHVSDENKKKAVEGLNGLLEDENE
jgi:integrase